MSSGELGKEDLSCEILGKVRKKEKVKAIEKPLVWFSNRDYLEKDEYTSFYVSKLQA